MRRARLVAAKRGTTLKSLFVAALERIAVEGLQGPKYRLSDEDAKVLEVNEFGLPVLSGKGDRKKVSNAQVNQLRNGIGHLRGMETDGGRPS